MKPHMLFVSPMRWIGFAALASALIAGCDFGDEPDVGGLVGSQFIALRLDETGLAEGALSAQSATHADTFLASLRKTLGRDPSSLDLIRVAVAVGATAPTGVSSWHDAFSGDITVSLVVEGSPPITAGNLPLPASGLAPIEGRVLVRRQTLDLFPDLRAGRFSVRLSAPSTRSPTEGFILPVRVELEFLVF